MWDCAAPRVRQRERKEGVKFWRDLRSWRQQPFRTAQRRRSLGTVGHYANTFSAREGECWRWVYQSDGSGRPTSCPEPVVWRGRYRTRRDESLVVDGYAGHASDERLTGVKRLAPASVAYRCDQGLSVSG